MDNIIDNEKNNELEKIDITLMIVNFSHALKKRWKQMLIIILVCAAGFGIYESLNYKATYTASATYAIYVGDRTEGTTLTGYYNNSAAEQVGKSFPYILTSSVLQRKVAETLNMPSIPGKVTAKVKENTNFITISVKDSEAERAYNTLQAVLTDYPEVSESIIGKITMELLDETGVPSNPDTPRNLKGYVAHGTIVGVMITILYLVLVILLNKTVLREEDCKKKINIKCLGSVPHIREKLRSHKVENHPNILKKNINRDFTESFQIIRNKIEQSSKKNHLKSIMITSAMPGEGKSTVAVNVALSLAQKGKKVALIDADLRNPSDAEIVGIQGGKGVIDYIKGEIPLSESIVQGKDIAGDNIPLLFVKGGKAVEDGAKYLGNGRMKVLIDTLEEKMDYVIVDTPPIGLLTDAGILAQYVDGAVFVVKQDYVKAKHILESMQHLTDSNVYMMGCVLNEE